MYRGKFTFLNDWASLIVGRKFTVFALFCVIKFRVISLFGGVI